MSKKLTEFSVVTVPFPFTDRVKAKRRPALVLSVASEFNEVIGHSVMAMITSSKNSAWPLDVDIRDLKHAGLPASSVVRMKLFTMDHRLVQSVIGHLSARDSEAVRTTLQKLLPLR